MLSLDDLGRIFFVTMQTQNNLTSTLNHLMSSLDEDLTRIYCKIRISWLSCVIMTKEFVYSVKLSLNYIEDEFHVLICFWYLWTNCEDGVDCIWHDYIAECSGDILIDVEWISSKCELTYQEEQDEDFRLNAWKEIIHTFKREAYNWPHTLPW